MLTHSSVESAFKNGQGTADVGTQEAKPRADGVQDTTDIADDEAVATQLQQTGEEVLEFVRQRPLVAVGVATVAGFLIGRAFSR